MGSVPSHGERSDPGTIVYQACRDGHTTALNEVLKHLDEIERKKALESRFKDGDDFATPLIIAAHNGNLKAVQILLKYKPGIELRGNLKHDDELVQDCTPLWAAAAAGNFDVVKKLITQRAKVDSKDLTGSTPLRAAAQKGYLDIVSCLVRNGADVNACKNDGSTALFPACYHGHTDVVDFLIECGANVKVKDKDDYTALHCATRQGFIAIANKLLSHRALQQRSKHRLTPLLSASNNCQMEMIEYLISRPMYTKQQRIDALELLGATIANDPDAYDIDNAFRYIKRGMRERFQNKLKPLPKRHMKSIKAYENRQETQTLTDVDKLKGKDRAIQMEGLIIRERILGHCNKELRSPIRYCGTVIADSGDFDVSFLLWRRALKISKFCNEPINEDVEGLTALFARMVPGENVLDIELIEEVFEQLVLEFEKLTEKSQLGKSQTKRQDTRAMATQLERLTYSSLYLLMIYANVTQAEDDKKPGRLDLLQRFRRQDPRTRKGDTLLHLAACCNTVITDSHVRSVCKLPCVKTMTLLSLGGFDVNALNPKGDTPLHVAVTFKPNPNEANTLKAMLELLIDSGADPKLENIYGQTAINYCATDEARRILSERSGLEAITVHSRDTDSSRFRSQDPVERSTTISNFSDVVKVTVLAQSWCSPFSALSYLTKEFAFHLAENTRVEVNLLVPDESLREVDKLDAERRGITIAEAKVHPGFRDPIERLYFPPNNLVTNVVVALNHRLGKIAHVLREHGLTEKRIQMVHSLNSNRETNVGLCEEADLAVGLGSKLTSELTVSLRYQSKKVIKLTPGIFSEFADLNHVDENGGDFRILVLSGNESTEFRDDRFHIAAQTISSLRDSSFYLVVIGVEKDKRSEFLKKCRENDVAEQQLIMKDYPVGEEDLKRLFCEVDLAIMLSAKDECGLIALCALSAGLPLYVCGDSAFADSLREVPLGRASIIENAENFENWTRPIKDAKVADRKFRLNEAKKLRSNFEETHNWKTQIESLVKQMLDMFKGD